jgi:hypothetical protein
MVRLTTKKPSGVPILDTDIHQSQEQQRLNMT